VVEKEYLTKEQRGYVEEKNRLGVFKKGCPFACLKNNAIPCVFVYILLYAF
jgi:hypothetical protein